MSNVACPNCGSDAVKAVSRAYVYQSVDGINKDDTMDLGIYRSDDVDFENQKDDYILCLDCQHQTSQVYPEKWRAS